MFVKNVGSLKTNINLASLTNTFHSKGNYSKKDLITYANTTYWTRKQIKGTSAQKRKVFTMVNIPANNCKNKKVVSEKNGP